MSLAPYFDRTKVAASQVVAGFDADAFTTALSATSVGISLGEGAATSRQGRACADLLIRLCARLYPTLAIQTVNARLDDLEFAKGLRELATAINPNITQTADPATVVHIGEGKPDTMVTTIYIGCDDWTGRLSMEAPLPIGTGPVPIGAGIAACLAASALFRLLLDPTAPTPRTTQLTALPDPLPTPDVFTLPDQTALVGAGAIGQSFLWAIANSPITGNLHVIEPEAVDLGNLQRYVLTDMTSVNEQKTDTAGRFVAALAENSTTDHLKVLGHAGDWADAMSAIGPTWDTVAVAVDSAEARCGVQASLPRHLLNAWTQTGDLGVSSHNFLDSACCACLYLPEGSRLNEDEIYATALGVPDRLMEVRNLLYTGAAVSDEFLEAVSLGLSLEAGALDNFQRLPIRELYVRGVCGGEAVPLTHNPKGGAVHVPLAHQSALAGVLLAAQLLQSISHGIPARTQATRIDIRRDPPPLPHQGASKDPRGLCICQDEDYTATFAEIWRVPHEVGQHQQVP